ncbi:WW domain-containing protein [Xylariales sp. AK1849]|nr:WW domain-containing protein [Xylariales sp. AK1849]
MAGPASPGTEGPTYEPPQLPPGWIAQWDGTSKKYYYVSISTGASQWETPSQAAPGGTPAQGHEHPYGVPGQQEVITHPDGTQTVKYADGRLEPLLSPDASRGLEGETGERGFGSFATNQLLNQISGSHGKQSNNSSSPLGGIAGQLIGGLSGGSSHNNSHGSGSSSSNPAGKLVGALASSIFSGGKQGHQQQPQNYHGGQSSTPQNSGGFAGSVMGGVANMFGGNQGHSNQNYGYSNSGQSGGYSGQAPPTSYQPAGSTAAYSSSLPNNQHNPSSYNAPASQQHGTPSYPPPPGQHGAPSYSAPSGQHNPSYGSPPPGQQHGYGHSPAPHGQHYRKL